LQLIAKTSSAFDPVFWLSKVALVFLGIYLRNRIEVIPGTVRQRGPAKPIRFPVAFSLATQMLITFEGSKMIMVSMDGKRDRLW
jgi:hypothetical protein